MEKKSFWEWYTETEKETGSLVTPASAAKMIGITRQYLEKIIASGRIQKHYHEDLPFIGMNEINEEIARRKAKIERENRKNLLLLKARKEQILDEIERIQEEKERRMEEEHSRENPEEQEIQDIEYEKEEIEYLLSVLKEEKNTPFPTGFKRTTIETEEE